MKKLEKHIILLYLVCTTILCSCRKLVQDEFPDFSDKPTVNCILIEGKTIKIHLSLAQKLGDNPINGLNNADISLYSDSVLAEKLSFVKEGLYTSTIIADTGKIYDFKIKISAFPKIEKRLCVPKAEKILAVEHYNAAGVNENGEIVPGLKITFSNNPKERKYYQILLKTIHYSSTAYAEALNFSDPVLLNESLPILVFSNEKIRDSLYSMYIQYTTNSFANGAVQLYPLVVELRTIDQAYYQYLKSLYLYEKGRFNSYIGEVFPTYPVYSNISEAYGIMGAFSSDAFDTLYPSY